MRVTLWLLRGHLPVDAVVRLTESYLTGDRVKSSMHSKDWSDIAVGGHMELITDAINSPLKQRHRRELLAGFASIGDMGMIELLLKVGVDDLTRALASAIESGQLEVAKLLHGRGATVVAADLWNKSDVHNPIADGDYDMCLFMRSLGLMVREDYVRYGSIAGNLDIISLVPDLTAPEQRTILRTLCEYNHLEAVSEFLAPLLHRRTANSRITMSRGLVFAAHTAANDVVEFLLSNNADPSCGMKFACRAGHFSTLEILIRAGATSCECGKKIADHSVSYSKKRRLEFEEAAAEEHRRQVAALLSGLTAS